MEIVGRVRELATLRAVVDSGRPEFLAVYGRRRVGKTFLIKEFFRDNFCFYATGLARGDRRQQLVNFNAMLNKYGTRTYELKATWYESFAQLIELLESSTRYGRKVVFIDEMPWMDTQKSDFLLGLEFFWNSWASSRPEVLLIACGSASSWMVDNLIGDYGGLFNRVTRRMQLLPFNLREMESLLASNGVSMSRYQLLECYMVFGGIPQYLVQLDSKLGLAQNIDALCFEPGAALAGEFELVFRSLFRHHERYQRVIEVITRKLQGLTRDEIVQVSGLPDGGTLTRTLNELEVCGFLRSYAPFHAQKKGTVYQSVDPFSNFHMRYLTKPHSPQKNQWLEYSGSPSHAAWRGYAFEQVCTAHLDQLLAALGVSGVVAPVSAWRSRDPQGGAQVDLVIDRRDDVVNLCEMKYASDEFLVTKRYAAELRAKRERFVAETRTHKSVHQTLVTTFGLERNAHADSFQTVITMEDLFRV